MDDKTRSAFSRATHYIRKLEAETGDIKFSEYGDAMDAVFVEADRQTARLFLSGEWYFCGCKTPITMRVDGEPLHKANYCSGCGAAIDWSEEVNE